MVESSGLQEHLNTKHGQKRCINQMKCTEAAFIIGQNSCIKIKASRDQYLRYHPEIDAANFINQPVPGSWCSSEPDQLVDLRRFSRPEKV